MRWAYNCCCQHPHHIASPSAGGAAACPFLCPRHSHACVHGRTTATLCHESHRNSRKDGDWGRWVGCQWRRTTQMRLLQALFGWVSWQDCLVWQIRQSDNYVTQIANLKKAFDIFLQLTKKKGGVTQCQTKAKLAGPARLVTRAAEVVITIRLKTNKVSVAKPRITLRFFSISWQRIGKKTYICKL